MTCTLSSSFASASSASLFRATRMRSYPSRANIRANSRPIPDEAQVMRTVEDIECGETGDSSIEKYRENEIQNLLSEPRKIPILISLFLFFYEYLRNPLPQYPRRDSHSRVFTRQSPPHREYRDTMWSLWSIRRARNSLEYLLS